MEASTIESERVVLAPLGVDDAEEMVEVLADRSLYEFIGGEPPTLAELRTRYERWVVGHSADGKEEWHNWIVRRRSDRRAVGTVQATIVDGGRVAEIAWVVGGRWQRQGFATEATHAAVDWLRAGGVREVIAHIHPDHVASLKVAERVGLVPTDEVVEGEVTWRMNRWEPT